MVIQKLSIGRHSKKTVYALCLDIMDTGKDSQELARFDTLETATDVLRYIRGDRMTGADIARARAAIQKVDAINES